MNEFHSTMEWIYKKRHISKLLHSVINDFPAIVLTGARQVGKSTLLQQEFSDFKYISLDDYLFLEQAKKDPLSLWKDADSIIIDEVQRVPELLSLVKTVIDSSKRKKRFILSGSSNLLLMKNVTESLAGRAIYFELLPMTFGEITENKTPFINFLSLFEDDPQLESISPPQHSLPFLLLRGFMPPLCFTESTTSILLWWESYIKTYLERDLRDIAKIDSLVDYRRVMKALAVRVGNLTNQTEIARDTGVSQPTVYRYLNLLEITNMAIRVPPYFTSKSKRITKTPKLFFVDPALSIHLSEYVSEDLLSKAREFGSYFENMAFLHLKVYSGLLSPKGNLFYYRTTSGQEVDFIFEHGKNTLAFEVKNTDTPYPRDIKNLLNLLESDPNIKRGILIYSGDTIRWLHSKILALPWWFIF
ncbi:MAG: ATP-binding protein [Syntrophorhabdaceae bacterium]|nr:ATP-binding protein [Syntrophorhabdaceae bacterium]